MRDAGGFGDGAQQRGLARAVVAGQPDPLGPADVEVEAVAVQTARRESFDEGDLAVRADRGLGQVDADARVLADLGLGGLQSFPGLGDVLGHRGLDAPRGGFALVLLGVADDGGRVGELLLPGLLAAGELGLHLDELAFLAGEFGLGVADGALGGLLLDRDRALVGVVVPLECADASGVQLGDGVDPFEQRPVVADHEQGALEAADRFVEAFAGGAVEVVRRLVEQQDVGAQQEPPGEADQHGLAARERRDGAFEPDVVEAELVERDAGAFEEVPVLADDGEVGLVGVAGFDRFERALLAGDAEQSGDGVVEAHGQFLRQVGHEARDGDAAGVGGQPPVDEAQQRRLAGAVVADQGGAAVGEDGVEAVEDAVAVGPGEAEFADGDESGQARVPLGFDVDGIE